MFYAMVSASYTIEQYGPPTITGFSAGETGEACEEWNGDQPSHRLELLRKRHGLA